MYNKVISDNNVVYKADLIEYFFQFYTMFCYKNVAICVNVKNLCLRTR